MRFVLAVLLFACSNPPPPTNQPTLSTEPAPVESVDGTKYLPKDAPPLELPANAPRDLWERSKLASIRIFGTEEDIAKRVKNTQELGVFLQVAFNIAQMSLGMSQKQLDATIRFDCAVGKHTVKIDSTVPIDPQILEYLQQDLGGMPSLDVAGDLAFELKIAVLDPRVYENWVDGKRYESSGGWNTYQPQGGRAPADPNQKVTLQYTRLLTPEDDIAKRTTSEELAAFVKAIHAHAEKTVGKLGKSAELMLQLKCSPAKHTVQIAVKGEPDDKVVQRFYDAIMALPPIKTTGDVELMLHFTIAP